MVLNYGFQILHLLILLYGLKMKKEEYSGFIVETNLPGVSTPETHNKWSLRASSTGELVFDNVKLSKDSLLQIKTGFERPSRFF